MSDYQSEIESFRSHKYRTKHLAQYYARMSQDNLGTVVDGVVGAILEAQGFSLTEVPRSVYKVEQLYESLARYAPAKARKLPGGDSSGIALAYHCFSRPKSECKLSVLPFNPATVMKITSNPSGSAGLTAYGLSKAEAQTRALERGMQTLNKQRAPEPCLAFRRTQFNDKTRLVWGYPYSMTAIEGLVAWPLINMFKSRISPMAFGLTSGALGVKMNVASYHKKYAYALDMSKFDSSISASLIHVAFKILRTWFDMDEVEPCSGCKVSEIFGVIENYFIHSSIVMPNGLIYHGRRHGVPSGSFFTQLVDSIVNCIIIGAVSAHFKLYVDKKHMFVLGDDSIFWSNRLVSIDSIAHWVELVFGIKVNTKKTAVTKRDEPVFFLGRYWSRGFPDLPLPEILARMYNPERFRKYSSDPKKRWREARLLLASFASTYQSAWKIAKKSIEPRDMWYSHGARRVDINVYRDKGRVQEVNPEFLSGLMRFRERFSGARGSRPTIFGVQLWL